MSKKLPTTLGNDLPALPDEITLSYEDSGNIDKVKRADIELFNAQLRIIRALWNNVSSIGAALALIKQTTDLIETRRKIMGLEYGASQTQNSKSRVFEPLA